MFKAMKFRVNSPEHSKQIQAKLFEMGYSWPGRGSFFNTDKNFLFADDEGVISWSDDPRTFMRYNMQEYILKTEVTLVPAPVEYVEYNGKKYIKSDFEMAIKGLEIDKN